VPVPAKPNRKLIPTVMTFARSLQPDSGPGECPCRGLSRRLRPSFALIRLLAGVMGFLLFGSSLTAVEVKLSKTRFVASGLPTIYATGLALPGNASHYRLRAKIVDPVNGDYHAADSGYDANNFQLNGVLPPAASVSTTYAVDLYVAWYDENYVNVGRSDGVAGKTIIIDPPIPTVGLTAYTFTQDNLPRIVFTGSPVTSSTYRLRAKISTDSDYASTSYNNNNTVLARTPGIGTFSVETYCVLSDGGLHDDNIGPFTQHTIAIGDWPGTGTGLLGQYFSGTDFSNAPVFARVDPRVYFDWGSASPDATRLGADNFAVRWTGQVLPKYSESYTFKTVSDDGVRLWVNGLLLIDHWVPHGAAEDTGAIILNGGQKYDIRMDYYENAGGATAQLIWRSASQVEEIIPQNQLYPADHNYDDGSTYYIRDVDYASGTYPLFNPGTGKKLEAGPTVNVLPGADVKYQSNVAVRLVPGFRAAANSRFLAQIGTSIYVPPSNPGDIIGSHPVQGPGGGDSIPDPVNFTPGDGWTLAARKNLGEKPTGGASVGNSLPAGWPTAAGNYVGTVKGAFSVGKGGAATYAIPISVSPGTAGMQPNLSLEYSSQAADGFIGSGWQLSGLVSISRGGASIVIDGFARGVNFDAGDRYYLNGSRLIVVSGSSYGADGAEYRAELDPSMRVIGYGTAGSGPSWFKVWMKDGTILELGNTENSRIKRTGGADIVLWSVNQASDRFSNSMKFSYKRETDPADGAELYPEEIKYTCRPELLEGYASVKFNYEARTDVSSAYIHGTKTAVNFRLKTIDALYGTQLFRRLEVEYVDPSNGDPSRVKTIKESVGSGAEYPVTTFNYQARGQTGFDYSTYPAGYQAFVGTPEGAYDVFLTGDVNGDGLTDVIRIRNGYKTGNAEFWVNDGHDRFTLVPGSVVVSDDLWLKRAPDAFLMADIDGDGKSELVVLNSDVAIVSYNGKSLSVRSLGLGNFNLPSWRGVADLNHDGRDDIALVYLTYNPNNGVTRARNAALISNGSTFSYVIDSSYDVGKYNNSYYVGDVRGTGSSQLIYIGDDGSRDVMVVYEFDEQRVAGGAVFKASSPTYLGAHVDRNYFPVDINGDGITDMLAVRKSGAQAVAELWMSDGAGLFTLTKEQPFGNWDETSRRYPIDYNGDSKCDIVLIWKGGDNKAHVKMWISTGSGFVAEDNGVLSSWRDYSSYHVGRFTADSKGDLLELTHTYPYDGVTLPRWNVDWYTHILPARGNNPNLLTEVVDGLGARTAISYLPLVADVIYEKGAGAVYPVADVRVPLTVVSGVEYQDGNGGSWTANYTYGGLRSDVYRGLLGFEWISTQDGSTGLTSRTSYFQGFPLTGIPKDEVISVTATGGVTGRTSYTANYKLFNYAAAGGSSKTYFPYLESSVTRSYELDSAAITTTRVENTFDDYGSLFGRTTHVYPGAPSTLDPESADHKALAFEEQLSVQFDDIPAPDWLIGLPRRIVTSKRKPGDLVSKTEVSSMEYYTDSAKIKSKKRESSSAALWSQEGYVYDAYGNIAQITTTGPDVNARVITTDYSASAHHPHAGRFPLKSYDALLHSVSYVYDCRLGLLKSRTDDANNLSATLDYDAFGRTTVETRPDGAQTETIYRWDATTIGYDKIREEDLAGPSSKAVYHVETRNTGAAPILSVFNVLGHVIQKRSVNADGLVVASDMCYDLRGNPYWVSRPYLSSATKKYWAWTGYDALNRPKKIEVPYEDLEPTVPTTAASKAVTQYHYEGLVTTVTNPQDQRTRTEKNAAGWTVSVVMNPPPAGGSASPVPPDRSSVTFAHDAFGRVTDATDDAGHVLSWKYDDWGRRLEMRDPDLGLTSYTYYSDGLTKSQTDANGKTRTYVYDAAGRRDTFSVGVQNVLGNGNGQVDARGVPVLLAEGQRRVKWRYDSAADKGVGQLADVTVTERPVGGSADLEISSQVWAYDDKGRVSHEWRTFGGKTFLVTQTYDAATGAPLIRHSYRALGGGSYDNGFGVINVYNDLGFLKEIRRDDPALADHRGDILWFSGKSDASGNVVTSLLGSGSTVERLFDSASGRLTAISTTLALPADAEGRLTRTWVQTVGFDRAANLVSRASHFPSGGSGAIINAESLAYDALNRLRTVDYANSLDAPTYARTKEYSYDQIGNIVSKSDVGAYTYDENHAHAVKSAGPGGDRTYDDAGNMRFGPGGLEVKWTVFNQPAKITRGSHVSSFVYDASEDRVLQDSDRALTYYIGSEYERVEPKSVGGAPIAPVEDRYYVATPIGRSIVVTEVAGTYQVRYLHGDHLGSIELVSTDSARVEAHYGYDAWGAARSDLDWINLAVSPPRLVTSRGFTDHEMLDDMGLVHMNGRIYDPVAGRFLSADPALQAPENPQNYNRYSYVYNNPLSNIDPSGHLTVDFSGFSFMGTASGSGGMGITVPDMSGRTPAGGGLMPLLGGVNVLSGVNSFSFNPAVYNSISAAGSTPWWATVLNAIATARESDAEERRMAAQMLTDAARDGRQMYRDARSAGSGVIAASGYGFSMGFGRFSGGMGVVEFYAGERVVIGAEGSFVRRDFESVSEWANHGLESGARAFATATMLQIGGSVSYSAVRGSRGGVKGLCFIAGTTIATASGGVPIESLKVGDRVLTSDRDAATTEIDPAMWRKITLRMSNPEHSSDVLDLELLRSESWMRTAGCVDGARIWFELDEMGLAGWADVTAIAPCPVIQAGPGRVVLATVTHFNSFVMEVRLADGAEVLRPTDRHRLFSVTRGDWVPSSQINGGEELATDTGVVCVESVLAMPGTHRVYNIEVETDHCFFAGAARVLSHNNDPCATVDVDVARERNLYYRETLLYRGNIDATKPFNKNMATDQPIRGVRALDGSLHIMQGNHRVYGAVESRASVPMMIYSPDQWEARTGMSFSPSGANVTKYPKTSPGFRRPTMGH
jgi:RHS repeat-associated protein